MIEPVFVKLTLPEKHMCKWCGRERWRYACARNLDAGDGPSQGNGSPDNHMRGCLCEYAASIALNLFWRPHIGETKAIDIGDIIEVRSTRKPEGALTIKPADADRPHVLVYPQTDLIYAVVGWIWPSEVADLDIIEGRFDPARYVPQSRLRSIASLKKIAHEAIARGKPIVIAS